MELFSFDLRSYLKKSAKYTLRSPLLYPVELLRTSVNRGATSVSLTISKRRFEIEDNGMGIGMRSLKNLSDAVDNSVSVEKKIAAISELKVGYGLGLIAVFAPDYEKIIIENSDSNGRVRINIDKDDVSIENKTEISTGTKIVIERISKNYKEEISLLKEYCRWVAIAVYLNGKKLGGEKSIPGTLVSLRIKKSENSINGICGIPTNDEMCKIWFLNNGLVTEKKIFPPYKGYIFYAVIEIKNGNSFFNPDIILPEVKKLYLYIAKNYSSVSNSRKERIKKLIFFHFRETGDRSVIDSFYPFKRFGIRNSLSFREVEEMAGEGRIYAVRDLGNSAFGSVKSGKNILVLSATESDFLINRIGLNITFIDPVRSRVKSFSKFKKRIIFFKDKLFLRLSSLFCRDVDPDLLWNEESGMLELLNYFFHSEKGKEILLKYGFNSGEIRIAKGISFYPLFFKKGDGELIGKKLYIYLTRSSLLIKKTAKFIEEDKKNIEILIKYIILETGRFLK